MPLSEDLLNPISGANPAGADLLEDPVFIQIKEARVEEDELPQGDWERPRKTADYPLVIKLASETLATKSKDLWVGAWLTEALLRRHGYGGLREGLGLLKELLARFWDDIYPQIEDGDAELRAAPLSWVGGYLDAAVKSVALNQSGHDYFAYLTARQVGYEADAEGDTKRKKARAEAVAEGKLTPEEFDRGFEQTPKAWYKALLASVTGCLEAARTLDSFSQQQFGDVAPNYRTLFGSLTEVRDVAQKLLEEKLKVDPDPPDPEPDILDIPDAGAQTEVAKVVSIEPADATDAASRIAAAAHFLQRQAPTNPASYLLLRGFRWGELRVKGDDLDPRLLSAPPTDLRTRLKRLLLDEKWEQLLEEGERVMATPHGRGWLDLQRYVLTACFKLGSEYENVALAIVGALTSLLRDLPRLPELTLMDDTPTANEETRSWLRDSGILQAAATVSGEAAAAAASSEGEVARPAVRQAFERARAEARAGRPEKAIEILMDDMEREKSERARFLRRAEIAGIIVEAGHEPVAMPILNELLQKIDAHKLDEWEEGALVAQPMGLLYECLNSTGGSDDTKQQLYRRICRLDPRKALELPGKRAGPGAEATQGAPAPPSSDTAGAENGQAGD